MSELLELTVAEAAERIGAGELSAAEYRGAWSEAAAGDDLNAYLWTGDGGDATSNGGSGPLAGIPIAVKDIFSTSCSSSRRRARRATWSTCSRSITRRILGGVCLPARC